MTDNGQSRSWWQTAPGIITAIAGLVTAAGGLLTILLQAGLIGPDTRFGSDAVTDARAPAASPAGRASTAENSASALEELESRLESVNIQLSTGTADDRVRVRGYMSDPDSAYTLLAYGCLDILAGRRLKRPAHLDMIDKWYTVAVGPDRYLSDTGTVRRQELESAIVKATNEIHGTTASSLDEIVEARR